jgi:hypothetical protein
LKESSGPADFLQTISAAPVTVDQWQLEKLALAAQAHPIWYYVPGLPQKYHSHLWGRDFASAADALEALAAHLTANAKVAVVPEGPYVFARPEEPVAALA